MNTLTQINLLWSIPIGIGCMIAGFYLASFFLAGKEANELKYPLLDDHEKAIG